jgi:plastocyanin
MTDVTTETTEVATDVETPPAVPETGATVPFWQRPMVERYVMPLIVPIGVVLAIVIFVLNISRVFLAAHNHTPVVICSIVLVAILLGATVFAHASLKTTSIALMTTAFVFIVFVGGWLVLGSSAEKKANNTALPASGPVDGIIKIEAAPTGGLTFAPTTQTVKTGVYQVVFSNGANAQHTLNFDDSSTLYAGLTVNTAGETQKARIFFGTAGDYTFYCAVTGHRAAGMQGTVKVTGPTVTLQQAEAAGKPST